MTSNEIEQFKTFCRDNQLKLTKERLAIFEVMLSIHEHFTVDDIYVKLRKKKLNIAPSSIYRFIPHLIKGKFLKSTFQNDRNTYYEHIIGHRHHDHMICESCGKIIEFFDATLEALQEKIAAQYQFTIGDHHMVMRGKCVKCRS
jgi:Fur family transcriptional regulator, ferric uptake regulator